MQVLHVHCASAFGLRWTLWTCNKADKVIGGKEYMRRRKEASDAGRPERGFELRHEPLQAALRRKVEQTEHHGLDLRTHVWEFSAAEWAKLGVPDLRPGDYVSVGNGYFCLPEVPDRFETALDVARVRKMLMSAGNRPFSEAECAGFVDAWVLASSPRDFRTGTR